MMAFLSGLRLLNLVLSPDAPQLNLIALVTC